MTIIDKILYKIVGDPHQRYIKKLIPVLDRIDALGERYEAMDDAELAAQTAVLREKLAAGSTLDDVLPEAFAVCREACDRRLGMFNAVKEEYAFDLDRLGEEEKAHALKARSELAEKSEWEVHLPASFYAKMRELHPESVRPFRMKNFRVQLIGGIVLHRGCIAEMSTGEGKTLAAVCPVYLNALSGKGTHVVTVNDYLARRDAETMGLAYRFLGLSVGLIVAGLNPAQRREAYGSDVTYGTNNEFGFDYLRDNMAVMREELVQRELNYAIVDEVDSILIDEARTPLIISGPAEDSTDKYARTDAIIPLMKPDVHYTVDEKARQALLTDEGVKFCEQKLGIDNLYGDLNSQWVHHIDQALKAHTIFKRDIDYVVENGEVVIIDENTGRKMVGRRYSDGLHQAIEAKEKVPIRRESQTLATITFQNFFRMYNKLAGMTGTADTEAREFSEIYGLKVVVIPTHKPCIRIDNQDLIYRSYREKEDAVVAKIRELHGRKQPVLVGTVSIEKSELLSARLKREGIAHDVLNAKNHAREAEIIKMAGHQGRVTISTNMAGRGTDIVLGPGVPELGGLYVLATERHESRRIDNQLRGRSGRQGDPGESQYLLSLDDNLMRIFGGDRLKGIMGRLGQEGDVITHPLVTKSVANAQRRVEGQNFEARKHLLEYDNVMNEQRKVIYGLRRRILMGEDIDDEVKNRVEDALDMQVNRFVGEGYPEQWDLAGAGAYLNRVYGLELDLESLDRKGLTAEAVLDLVIENAWAKYRQLELYVAAENIRELERRVMLITIDQIYKEHLRTMDALRDAIRFHGYAQRDPLMIYKKEGFALFSNCMDRIALVVAERLLNVRLRGPDDSVPPVPLKPVKVTSVQGAPQGAAPQVAAPGTAGAAPRPVRQASPVQQPRQYPKVGRNDPCPCGSGKKYKKCHGADAE
ncbi:MAG: preprotein translocase subunit SecA [Fibrobacterales bacterium]|nr:preprotein translocase subunit SecA [Fibrobacterales bacterium]